MHTLAVKVRGISLNAGFRKIRILPELFLNGIMETPSPPFPPRLELSNEMITIANRLNSELSTQFKKC